MNIRQLFILNRWKLFVAAVAWIVSVVLHNIVSGILYTEEPVFFTIAVILIPAYIVISGLYTLLFRR